MKINDAYDILGLSSQNSYDKKVIKRKYHSLCLKYHPDKNNNNKESKEKFQQINEAYQLLTKNSINNCYSYDNHLDSILDTLLPYYLRNDAIYSVIKEILNKCGKLAVLNIQKLDVETIEQIYKLLIINKELLHISDEICEKVKNIIQEKRKNDECVILHPSLDDLFSNNLYKLNHQNENYVIPLWHNCLVYQHNNNDLYIKCIPKYEDENIFINEKNDIYISLDVGLSEIWEKDYFNFYIGNHVFVINCKQLAFKNKQTIILFNQGISKANKHNIYDINRKSNVHVTLFINKEI
tara:strand:+ start:209 stop:1093 length:885 start_codon:yes stop_codon:yes gene_type:complete